MTSSEPLQNPYNPYRPTINPDMFFGREDVYTFLRERLVASSSDYAVALIGPPGIGKTSTLIQIGQHIEPRYILAYVSMAQIDFREPGALFIAMADAARTAMEDAGISTLRLPPLPQEAASSAEEMWQWFSATYLEVVLSALRNLRRLLFLFDETTILLDAIDRGEVPAETGQTLARIIIEDRRMDIVFAVDAIDEDRLPNFPPLAEPMLLRRLTALDEDSAAALTRQPAADVYQLEDAAVEAIYAVTGGHPFLLHLVNGLIWDRSAARGHRQMIDLDDVRAVLPAAVEGADEILSPAWEDSSDNERYVLTAMTDLTTQSPIDPITPEQIRAFLLRENNVVLDETAISAALRRLEYRDVFRASAGGYHFSTNLQFQWMRSRLAAVEALPDESVQLRRRRSRWLLLPVLLLAVVAGALALWLGRSALAQTQSGTLTAPARTVTLALNVEQTGQAISATETTAAQPTSTSTATATSSLTATIEEAAPILAATSTSVIGATLTYTPSITATLTLTAAPPAQSEATTPPVTATEPAPTSSSTPLISTTAAPVLATATTAVTAADAATAVINTPVPTLTLTFTSSPSFTPTPTFSPTPTLTLTYTRTFTFTPTNTATRTFTVTVTPSPSRTRTRTATLTPSRTRTATLTPPPFPTGQVVATQNP